MSGRASVAMRDACRSARVIDLEPGYVGEVAPTDDDHSDPLEEQPADDPVLLLDETEDGLGAAADLDAGETGSAVLGEAGERVRAGADDGPSLGPPPSSTAADRVPLAAEEAAVHLIGEDDEDDEGSTAE